MKEILLKEMQKEEVFRLILMEIDMKGNIIIGISMEKGLIIIIMGINM